MNNNYIIAIFIVLLSLNVHAQIELTQSATNRIIPGTVSCNSQEPDFITADNIYYRAFNLNALGYSEFFVESVEFGVEEVANPSPDFSIDIIIYGNTGDGFPNGTLIEISRVSVPLLESDSNTLKTVPIVAQVTQSEMVVAISIPNEIDNGGTTRFFIGGNADGETAPTYTSNTTCGATDPVTFESLGFNDQHLILTVTGSDTLSNEDSVFDNVSMSPNPMNNVLNINIGSSASLKTVELYNVQGQLLLETVHHKSIDVSSLSSGQYIIKVITDQGSITKKLTKK